MIQEDYVHEPILAVKIKLNDKEVIVAYGNKEGSKNEEQEKLFVKLQRQIDN